MVPKKSVGPVRILHADGPCFLARWRAEQILVATRIDKPFQAVTVKDHCRNFYGKAFRNAAQIDLHTRPGKAHGVRRGIKHEIPVVDERPHRGKFLGRRLVGFLVVKSPKPNERTDRHVKAPPLCALTFCAAWSTLIIGSLMTTGCRAASRLMRASSLSSR